MANVVEKIRRIYSGKGTRREHTITLLLSMACLLIGFALAQLFFPGGYSIFRNKISNQGGIIANPIGRWFFYIGGTSASLLMFATFIYYYKCLQPSNIWARRLFLFNGLIGVIGFLFVVIFPEEIDPIHDISSFFAFGGFFLAALSMFPILLLKWTQGRPWRPLWGMLLVYGLFFTILSIWGYHFFAFYNVVGYVVPCPLLGESASQWGMFVGAFTWIFGIFFVAPHPEPISS